MDSRAAILRLCRIHARLPAVAPTETNGMAADLGQALEHDTATHPRENEEDQQVQ